MPNLTWLIAALLAGPLLSACSGSAPCTKQRSAHSELTLNLCVHVPTETGLRRVGDSVDYPYIDTDSTYRGVTESTDISCEGTSYAFGSTEATDYVVTLRLEDETGADILPPLDLGFGDAVKIHHVPQQWVPPVLSILDQRNIVFSSGSQSSWLNAERAVQVDAYCITCGRYGVYSLRFAPENGDSGVTLRPGEVDDFTYDDLSFGVANVEATRWVEPADPEAEFQVMRSDSGGWTQWAVWRQ